METRGSRCPDPREDPGREGGGRAPGGAPPHTDTRRWEPSDEEPSGSDDDTRLGPSTSPGNILVLNIPSRVLNDNDMNGRTKVRVYKKIFKKGRQ